VMPSSIADKIEFVASCTSSVYDAGLYVILPADFVSLAACGSALHAVVSLCLLRAEPLLKGRTDFMALKEPPIWHAGWMRRETSRQEDCIMWVDIGGACGDGCGGKVGGGWDVQRSIRASGNSTLLQCYILIVTVLGCDKERHATSLNQGAVEWQCRHQKELHCHLSWSPLFRVSALFTCWVSVLMCA
jgi:hypothetical protein